MGHGENRTACVSTNVLISLSALCSVPVSRSYACGFSCTSQDLMQLRCCWPNIFGLGFYLGFFFPFSEATEVVLSIRIDALGGSQSLEVVESALVFFLWRCDISYSHGHKIWTLKGICFSSLNLGMLVSRLRAGILVLACQFSIVLQCRCRLCNTGISPVAQTFSDVLESVGLGEKCHVSWNAGDGTR